MRLNGKAVNLGQLETELRNAGVAITKGIGVMADDLHTYTSGGDPVSITGSTAQGVVNAHVASPAAPLLGIDFVTGSQSPDQMATVVTNLRAFLNNPSPTNADSIAALKLVIRVVLWMCRKLVMALL
jgi:hypothetical protein